MVGSKPERSSQAAFDVSSCFARRMIELTKNVLGLNIDTSTLQPSTVSGTSDGVSLGLNYPLMKSNKGLQSPWLMPSAHECLWKPEVGVKNGQTLTRCT